MKRNLRIFGIVLLTVFLLAIFLRRSDPGEVWALLRAVNPLWLIPGFAANLCALVCRVQRWRTILRPSSPPRFYPTFFAAAIGFMSSALLPIRAGDVIRPALLSRRTDIRFSSALGTVLTEKILDITAICTLFVGFVIVTFSASEPIGEARGVFLRSAGGGAAVLLTGVVTLVGSTYLFRDRVRRLVEWISRILPHRLRESFLNLFDSFIHSLRLPRNRMATVRVLLLTALIWIFLTSQFFFVMKAFGQPLPYRASILVTALSILGFSIPTPGGVGGFHKACQLVLVNFYGFEIDTSVAVALVFHLVGTLPILVTGATLFLHEGMSWKQLGEIEKAVPPAVDLEVEP